jgi:hypothetical protein
VGLNRQSDAFDDNDDEDDFLNDVMKTHIKSSLVFVAFGLARG